MKRFVLTKCLLFCCFIATVSAQTGTNNAADDTLYTVALDEFHVTARWKNDTERYHYNQLKYYVTTILPYVNAASTLFIEINTKMEQDDHSKREWKKYVRSKEDEVRTKFEDKVKGLNVTQGGLLVKLIARQTNINIYKMLVEFKNPLVAMKWQGWSRLHGLNLDKIYNPDDEPKLELIMEDLGYPLPPAYALGKKGNG